MPYYSAADILAVGTSEIYPNIGPFRAGWWAYQCISTEFLYPSVQHAYHRE